MRRRYVGRHRKGVRYPCLCAVPEYGSARVRLDALLPLCGRCGNEFDPRPVAQWCDLDSLLPVARTVLLRDPRHRTTYMPGATWRPLPPTVGPTGGSGQAHGSARQGYPCVLVAQELMGTDVFIGRPDPGKPERLRRGGRRPRTEILKEAVRGSAMLPEAVIPDNFVPPSVVPPAIGPYGGSGQSCPPPPYSPGAYRAPAWCPSCGHALSCLPCRAGRRGPDAR